MGRPSMSEQRRIEIGRALQACMIRNGSYESTSVKDIAQEAGVATSLVHHYFVGKDEILIMMAEIELLSVSNTLEDLLRTNREEERAACLRELLSDTNQSRFLMMLYALGLSMPEVAKLVRDHRAALKRSVSQRMERKGECQEQAGRRSSELVFLMESAVLQSAVESGQWLEDMMLHKLEECFPTQDGDGRGR